MIIMIIIIIIIIVDSIRIQGPKVYETVLLATWMCADTMST